MFLVDGVVGSQSHDNFPFSVLVLFCWSISIGCFRTPDGPVHVAITAPIFVKSSGDFHRENGVKDETGSFARSALAAQPRRVILTSETRNHFSLISFANSLLN